MKNALVILLLFIGSQAFSQIELREKRIIRVESENSYIQYDSAGYYSVSIHVDSGSIIQYKLFVHKHSIHSYKKGRDSLTRSDTMFEYSQNKNLIGIYTIKQDDEVSVIYDFIKPNLFDGIIASNILDGPYKQYYSSGIIKEEGIIKYGYKSRLITTYYNNGKRKEAVKEDYRIEWDKNGDTTYFRNNNKEFKKHDQSYEISLKGNDFKWVTTTYRNDGTKSKVEKGSKTFFYDSSENLLRIEEDTQRMVPKFKKPRIIYTHVFESQEPLGGYDGLKEIIYNNMEGIRIKRKQKGKHELFLTVNKDGQASAKWASNNRKWVKSKLAIAVLEAINSSKWKPARTNMGEIDYTALWEVYIY